MSNSPSTAAITPDTFAKERSSMPKAARLDLIQRVLAKAFEETESWKDDFLGVALAYLAMAIADGKTDSYVDWTDENGNPDTAAARTLFRSWFAADDLVWLFILP